jgi:DNA polymerase-3 subunit gamma/tau
MPVQALYRKWRPQLWDEVVGQDHVVQTLRHALASNRIAHAYLFAGPRGCGKTTSARLVAKALNCLDPEPSRRPCNVCEHCVAVNEGRFLDLIEIDGASNNSVENVRELRDKINFAPSQGRFKIYIIDEVHMLSLGAFNALLKTLEEPPAHAVFILATTESHKIPATVASRCQRFEFRRIPVADIVARLQSLCAQEGIKAEKAALELVARQSTGALRDAISLLDQLVSADGSVTLARTQALLGTAVGQSVQDLSAVLAAGDTTAGLDLVNAAIDAGTDPRQFARQMVDYLRALLLVRLGNAALVEATAEDRTVMARQAEQWTAPRLLSAIRAFTTAANETRGGWQPQLPLELAVVEITSPAAPEPATVASDNLLVERTSEMPASSDLPVSTPPATRSGSAASSPASAWQRTLDLLLEKKKLTRLTKSELERSAVERLEDACLYVVTSANILSRLKERPEFQSVINDALSEVMGAPHRVKFQPGEPGRGKPSESKNESPSGLVAAALDLGGQIVE